MAEEKLNGSWKREGDRLQTEIVARLIRLRKEGVLRSPQQLKDWLPRLNGAILAALDFDEPRPTGGYPYSRSKK